MSRDTLILPIDKRLCECKCPKCNSNFLHMNHVLSNRNNVAIAFGLWDGSYDNSYIECLKCNTKYDFEYDKPKKIKV